MIYTDLNQNTPNKYPYRSDLDSIYQSIRNILGTKVGERLFNPLFGSSLGDQLFEIMDDEAVASIYTYIVDAISRWEPRVQLVTGQCTIVPNYDDHSYEVGLFFRVIGLGDDVFEMIGSLTK